MKKVSLYAYYCHYIQEKKLMSYPIFRKEIRLLFSDPSFYSEFGKYKFRALTEKQINILNRELID